MVDYTYLSVADGLLEKRAPHREGHLAAAERASAAGHLLLGGASLDAAHDDAKAYLAFRVPSGKRAIVDAFVASDPYVRNGIVTHHAVREWSVIVGSAHEVADE
eukprot:PRCOL_00001964-RA